MKAQHNFVLLLIAVLFCNTSTLSAQRPKRTARPKSCTCSDIVKHSTTPFFYDSTFYLRYDGKYNKNWKPIPKNIKNLYITTLFTACTIDTILCALNIDYSSVKHLSIGNFDLSKDFVLLKKFTNLDILDVSFCKIKDASKILANLNTKHRLTTISFQNNKIISLPDSSQLLKAKYWAFRENRIVDIDTTRVPPDVHLGLPYNPLKPAIRAWAIRMRFASEDEFR